MITIIRIENECMDCAVPSYPCSSTCPLTHVEHIYCDLCGAEIYGEVHHSDCGEDICEDCIALMAGDDEEWEE